MSTYWLFAAKTNTQNRPFVHFKVFMKINPKVYWSMLNRPKHEAIELINDEKEKIWSGLVRHKSKQQIVPLRFKWANVSEFIWLDCVKRKSKRSHFIWSLSSFGCSFLCTKTCVSLNVRRRSMPVPTKVIK